MSKSKVNEEVKVVVSYLSEAHKVGIVPPKPIEDMTEDELRVFRNSFDPDMMGFYETEIREDTQYEL